MHTAQLPSNSLGDNRCFEIDYYGHGDICASTWIGSPNDRLDYRGETLQNFGFTHTSDTLILAALIGYLRRAGTDESEVVEIIREAGQELLAEPAEPTEQCYNLEVATLARIASGAQMYKCSYGETKLQPLTPYIPSRPGVFTNTGGSAIHTQENTDAGSLLVFARYTTTDTQEIALLDTATFSSTDIPDMARLACNHTLGEYRKEARSFIANELGGANS